MDSSNVVLKYLRDQNRPYSLNDIFTNLHKEVGKTAIQKSLDILVQDGLVIEKTYGKQKVYAFNQRNECPSSDGKNDQDIDLEIQKTTAELSANEKQLKEYESVYGELKSSVSTEEAEKELIKLSKEVEEMTREINMLKSDQDIIPASDCEKIISSHRMLVGEWKKRKKQCIQMISAITENLPQNKTEFIRELGLETDEDLNLSVTTFQSIQC